MLLMSTILGFWYFLKWKILAKVKWSLTLLLEDILDLLFSLDLAMMFCRFLLSLAFNAEKLMRPGRQSVGHGTEFESAAVTEGTAKFVLAFSPRRARAASS